MKFKLFIPLLLVMLTLSGCGGGEVVVTVAPVQVDIPSSLALDGYIVENPVTLALTPVPSPPSVFAGIDYITGAEYRAFLGFPLSYIPLNALIDRATLDIVVRDIRPRTNSIPLRIELVSFDAPLLPNDFDRIFFQPAVFVSVEILPTAVNQPVKIDITTLMLEAQRLRRSSPQNYQNFQVRILLDFGLVTESLIEIDDTSPSEPLLKVDYY
jgi:hypothetical protein